MTLAVLHPLTDEPQAARFDYVGPRSKPATGWRRYPGYSIVRDRSTGATKRVRNDRLVLVP